MRTMVSIFIGIIIIYGMFFSKYHLSESTDKTYKILWAEYKFEDSKNIIMKKDLTFMDGLNNGTVLLGNSLKKFFIAGWDFFNTFTPYISLLDPNFLIKILLYIIAIFVSLILAFLAIFIFAVVIFYKLLFFEAPLSYYAGFCVSFFGILFISKYVDESDQGKTTTKNLAS